MNPKLLGPTQLGRDLLGRVPLPSRRDHRQQHSQTSEHSQRGWTETGGWTIQIPPVTTTKQSAECTAVRDTATFRVPLALS